MDGWARVGSTRGEGQTRGMSNALLGDAAYVPTPNPTYRVIRALGGTGAGTFSLLLLEHVGFGDFCVQKTIVSAGMPTDVAFREPRILDKFRDDELFVPVREAQFGLIPNTVTWVMPFYQEGSARGALEAGHRFPLEEAVTVTCDLLDAISTLYAQEGYVHGDIKTAQALLRKGQSRSALADFGSAVKLDPTGTGPLLLPTLVYLAPEAWLTKRVSLASDMFSAGLSAFEILCGPIDFTLFVPPVVIPRLNAGQSPIPASALRWQPHVPDAMRRAINRALSLDPARRPTPDHLRDQLRRGLTINWRRVDVDLGPAGTWVGTWPVTKPAATRSRLRVSCAQRPKGGFEIIATQQIAPTGPWRRIPGLSDITAPAASVWSDLRLMFSRLEDLVRQRTAARR